jgi:YD repeat-containing protein
VTALTYNTNGNLIAIVDALRNTTGLTYDTFGQLLRTLRRALYLAAEWGKSDRRPKITMVKGERQRDRVLTDAEVERYLEACEQPWARRGLPQKMEWLVRT